jgi:hypothetical protein
MKRGFDEIESEEELTFILSSIRFPIEIGVMILNLLREQSFIGFLTFLSVIFYIYLIYILIFLKARSVCRLWRLLLPKDFSILSDDLITFMFQHNIWIDYLSHWK